MSVPPRDVVISESIWRRCLWFLLVPESRKPQGTEQAETAGVLRNCKNIL